MYIYIALSTPTIKGFPDTTRLYIVEISDIPREAPCSIQVSTLKGQAQGRNNGY
jgi:hypothetical protein